MMNDKSFDAGKHQILIVDDVPSNIKLLAKVLSDHGYRVRPATSGPLALRSVAVELPDLILLDIKMPKMDGYQVCRTLKADKRFCHIPIIFISALGETEDKLKGFAVGGLDYISKPFEPVEVLARIESHLRLYSLQQEMTRLVAERTDQLSLANAELSSEIEERNRAEGELRRLNRSLQMFSECNQALVHSTDELPFIEGICRIIVESGNYKTACVAFAEQDPAQTVRPVAYAGCELACLKSEIHLSWADRQEGRNPLGRAIRTGKTVVYEDLSKDTDLACWCPAVEQRRCRSVIAFPLFIDRQTGVLCIVAQQPAAFTVEEQQLLTQLAADVAYGLRALRAEKERRQSVGALQEKEARMESIIRASPTGIAIVANRIFLEVNTRLCEILGYAEEELVGRSSRLIYLTEDEHSRVGDQIHAEIKAKGMASLESQFRRRDGRVIDVLLNSTLIAASPHQQRDKEKLAGSTTEEGPAREYNITVLDISERKRMEQELRDSEIRYRTIFDNTGTAMVIFEEDLSISLVNAEFIRLTGYSRQEIERTMSWSQLIVRECRQQLRLGKANAQVAAEGAADSYEAQIQRKDHRLVEVFTTVVTIPGSSRQVASLIDITERKKLEARVLQSQKMEAIGNLAGGIAHDFNNILNAIIGYTEMALTSSPIAPDVQRYLGQVYQAGKRAGELVNQILTFCRQSEQQLRPISLILIAKEVLKLIRSSLPTTIELSRDFRISQPDDTILADATQMHQVLMNLCSNAAQAMAGTGGKLTITLEPVETADAPVAQIPELAPGRYIRMEIRDTGQGIEPTLMERIFEPYFTTKETGEGTGMGLAVVLGIVERHNGAISVDSEPGRGSAFQVYLPRLEKDLRHSGNALKREVAPRGDEHILLVDDEPMLVTMGEEMLGTLGYTITGTTNSLEALELFRSSPEAFDLVFTDMTMPKLTGIELARQCLRIRPDIPIILVSGYSELLNEQVAREAGISAFVVKPYELLKIASTIRRVLAGA